MKKTLLFLLTLFATNASYSQVSFGIKTGMNIATTKDLIEFPKNRVGWYVGGFVKVQLREKLFLQPEYLFSSKGYKYVDLSNDKKVAMRLNYFNVPILVGYEIDNKTKIVLGTEIGYLVKAINRFNNENVDATSSFPHRFDIGLDIGLAYNITESLGAEIRYNYGFKNLYQIDAVGNRRGESSGGNRVFQVGVYYIFHK